jgi:tetratricopeptide (TPR) repeat protein
LKRLNRLEEALAQFRESILWSELVENDVQIVDDLINIGSIQIAHNLPDSALVTFERSYQLAIASEYSLGMPSILRGLSAAYEGIGRLDLALSYAQASLDSARALDITEEMIGALEQLADVQQKLGKFALANTTLQTYIHLKDSLFSTDKALEFGQLEQSFDYERKEFESAILAEQTENARRIENRQQYIIAFAWLMAVVIVLLIGVRYARAERVRYIVVFVSLLFFFEFLLVLLDGYVDGLTGGLPIPKLAANIALAAIIAPLNTVLERRLVKKKSGETESH